MRDTINSQGSALIKWVAGFLEEGSPQSSTRIVMYAFTASAITYAFRPSPDLEILGALIVAALSAGGIKLAKDIKSMKKSTPEPVE